MLSEQIDGDYIVRRFLLKRQGDAEYSVRYLINLATLNATLNGNPKELGELNSFVQELMQDSLIRVSKVKITGYASPDGPVSFNETLARNRARNFRNFVDRKYGFSKKYDVEVSSVAEDWEMCRELVAQSSVPDKQAVLAIFDTSRSPEQKEVELKKIPAAWDYMARNILPPLRRVELVIDYNRDEVVVERMLIPCPTPAPEPAPEPDRCCNPCNCIVIDEAITGLIVEMPETEADYRREMRQIDGEIQSEVNAVERMAKREAREAKRLAREELREVRKIAKKEAKAAKKAGKMARDLERF